MSRALISPCLAASLRVVGCSFALIAGAACGDESAAPSDPATPPTAPAAQPTDSATPPTDSATPPTAPATPPTDSAAPATAPAGAVLAALDNRSASPGIVFGTWNMSNSYLNSVHTGWANGGPLDPSNILSWLSGARAKSARVVIKLCKGRDSYVKNDDGTFSLSKWKTLVGRYQNVGLNPYIADGTILGHLLIDEPHRADRWGGKAISPATLEAMGKYSRQLWPGMTTMVGEEPRWLASSTVTYVYLDAAWAQYTSNKGGAADWIAAEVSAAKGKGLGLVVGMNVLDGGNGSSRIAGYTRGKYAMSASEIRSYASALLAQGYGCGFFSWAHDSDYYGRSDIKSAMSDMSSKARAHAKTSCRQ
jgi:hypothetical protein